MERQLCCQHREQLCFSSPSTNCKTEGKKRLECKHNATTTYKEVQSRFGMGGVDVIDRLLGSYRPIIRDKKWYWPLIINAINISVVAAW